MKRSVSRPSGLLRWSLGLAACVVGIATGQPEAQGRGQQTAVPAPSGQGRGQAPPGRGGQPTAEGADVHALHVQGGVYVLVGGGGNVTVQVGDDGVLLVDESALPKQGQQSVGVAPQYCGALGKVANCQVGVYVGYVSRKGYTLLEGQLFVPECWFDAAHAPLRQQTGMPTDLTFQTKPQLAVAVVQRIVERGTLPVRWVAADALYGDSPAFRDDIATLGLWFFTEVACSLPARPTRHTASAASSVQPPTKMESQRKRRCSS